MAIDHTDLDQQFASITGLADPLRRALYRFVAEQGVAVGRDDAARAVGIGRSLAGYHLDKLVDDGLLEAGFERRTGRSGPGAGRPAKLYVRAPRQIELSLPARDYAALAELLALAVEADPSGAAQAAFRQAAHALGTQLGADIADRTAPEADRHDVLTAARQVLADRGYEPYGEPDGVIRLRNCPFDRLAAEHRQLVCGANLAMLAGLADRLGGVQPVQAKLDPQPGQCCVALATANGNDASKEPPRL
jgi:predicted ArsR family transcriptional regulator